MKNPSNGPAVGPVLIAVVGLATVGWCTMQSLIVLHSFDVSSAMRHTESGRNASCTTVHRRACHRSVVSVCMKTSTKKTLQAAADCAEDIVP